MIEVRNLEFSVKGRSLLRQVSLDVKGGEFWAIVGANGAGKSTVMKLLSREYNPSGGSIVFHGKELSRYKLKDLAKMRAVLAQQNNITLSFPVREIVLMGRYPFYDSHPSIKDYDIVLQCLRKVGIEHLADRIFPTLSGGEQQRVQLARTLAQVWEVENGLVLLDEPTTGMDLLHQYETFQLAKELTSRQYAVVAVVHDLNQALQFSDKVLMLKSGAPFASGEPEAVLTEKNIEQVFGLKVRIIQAEDELGTVIIPEPYVVRAEV